MRFVCHTEGAVLNRLDSAITPFRQCKRDVTLPWVESDLRDPGSVTFAESDDGALLDTEHGDEIILAARCHILTVWTPRAAQQSTIVTLRPTTTIAATFWR